MRSPSPAVHPDLILGICCLSLLVVSMDVTIVNVALPAIQHDLHANLSHLQWVMDAYTLIVASLLMLAGSTADRIGRRRVFQTGMAVFTVGSFLCSLAPSIGCLIFFRALQGLGASMLNPVALSIIVNTFPETKARARAIGVWGAVAGASLALGPLLGGALTESIGWRSIFWVNLPIGIFAMVMTARFVPESRAPRARPVDLVGQALVFAALASLVYAVIEGPRAGWASLLIEGLLGLSLVSTAALIFYERRRIDPLLDLRFFGSVPFSSATVIAVCSFAAFACFLFLNALFLQQVRGLSALATGLCTLPMAAMTIVCPPISGRLVNAYGTRPSLLLAGACILVSGGIMTSLAPGTPLPLLIFCYFIFGVGFGLVNIPISHTAVSGMPRAQAGVAAAVASTSRQIGASLGIALAGTIVHAGRARGIDFTPATHAVWWLIAGCGAVVMGLGWACNTAWARATAQNVAHLLEEPAELRSRAPRPAGV
jgi:EmrB/QacA subfamily drug resistance transporter